MTIAARLLAIIILLLARPVSAAPPVTVAAAVSLTEVLEAAGRAWTRRSGIPVRYAFGSTAAVVKQLEGGGRADLLIAADREWMDYAIGHALVLSATRRTLAGGRLALVAARGSSIALRIGDRFPLATALGSGGRLALGDPDYVPAGRYAKAALLHLGVWDSVAPRLARADSVRVALHYVARGEAPLGIVYETDARIEPGVRILGLFPADSHPSIVYPAALTPAAGPSGRSFYAFLRGPGGQAIFRRFGFRTR